MRTFLGRLFIPFPLVTLLATGLQMVSGMSCEEYQFLSEAKNNLTAAWRERGSTWQVIESRRFLVV